MKAFPNGLKAREVDTLGGRYEGTYVKEYESLDGGMGLRDYFAIRAMQGLMMRGWDEKDADKLFAIWSRSAYGLADAMLKERSK